MIVRSLVTERLHENLVAGVRRPILRWCDREWRLRVERSPHLRSREGPVPALLAIVVRRAKDGCPPDGSVQQWRFSNRYPTFALPSGPREAGSSCPISPSHSSTWRSARGGTWTIGSLACIPAETALRGGLVQEHDRPMIHSGRNSDRREIQTAGKFAHRGRKSGLGAYTTTVQA
jgi:hypothetical protein